MTNCFKEFLKNLSCESVPVHEGLEKPYLEFQEQDNLENFILRIYRTGEDITAAFTQFMPKEIRRIANLKVIKSKVVHQFYHRDTPATVEALLLESRFEPTQYFIYFHEDVLAEYQLRNYPFLPVLYHEFAHILCFLKKYRKIESRFWGIVEVDYFRETFEATIEVFERIIDDVFKTPKKRECLEVLKSLYGELKKIGLTEHQVLHEMEECFADLYALDKIGFNLKALMESQAIPNFLSNSWRHTLKNESVEPYLLEWVKYDLKNKIQIQQIAKHLQLEIPYLREDGEIIYALPPRKKE